MFNRFSLFIIFLIVWNSLISQNLETGIPSFKNISPLKYGQESQNFSILQDKNHLLYFGNVNGIMEYDNSTWHLIPVPGRPVMDINSENEIFYGGYNQIGKLIIKNSVTQAEPINYHAEINPGQINKVVAFKDKVFFTSEHQLISYINDSVEVELSNIPGVDIFKIYNELFVFVPDRGLYIWGNSGVESYKNTALFKDVFIEDMQEVNDSLILIKPKNKKGFLFYDGITLKPFYTDADEFLENQLFSGFRILSDGNIIIGTHWGGVVCIDKNGRFLYNLNRENGLRDNQVTDIFIDKNNKVWITTFNGITLIDTPSAFSFFDSSFGINGAVLSVVRFNDKIYVATTSGVYKYNYKMNYDLESRAYNIKNRFTRVQGIKTLCWQLIVIDNKLYAVSLSGLFLIEGETASRLLRGQFNAMIRSKINPDICLIGTNRGLLISNYSGGIFDTIGYVKDFKFPIRSISEEEDGTVWLGTNADGLFKMNFKNNYTPIQRYVNYNHNNAFPKGFNWVDVYRKSFGTFFSTQKGLFLYNNKTNSFELDTLLGYDFSAGDRYLYPIIEDHNKNIWFSCTFVGKYFRETGVAIYVDKNNYVKETNKFSILKEYPIESIYAEKTDIIWFGSTETLIRYDHNFIPKSETRAPCFIRRVTIKNDSVISIHPSSSEINEPIVMNFTDRTIRFDFAYLKHNTYGENEFQVLLEGFDKEWSDWSKETFKEYTALTEKEYVFRVRARDIYGNVSEEAYVYFRVLPPFYRTIYAYIFYILVFGAIIYLILKFNELRHAKERYRLEKLVEDRTNELAHQKEQTEELVKKLLPDSTVAEIQKTGEAKSKKIDMVSVLFADIQGFTKIAEEIHPDELIKHLNNIFSSFDSIIGNYNIQKIKTIGDAYMCAGGMPIIDNTNPIEVVLAGLEMQREIIRFNNKYNINIQLRIGVHTGPIVAGVVGSNKLEYDIWGDTVNIASRMESHGVINEVNVSGITYNYIADFFNCENRGKISIKYKGEMEMYFVKEIKKELALEEDLTKPNKNFFIKLQHIKFKAIQEEALAKLEKSLPKNLYYHNIKHTLNVLYVVENIARKEKVTEEELLLLKCAAIFHDIGFIVSYDDNEKIGAKMAEETLKKYRFSQDQIDTVKRLIMATQMPPNPKDLLERIICDADLDYLGRPDFIPISQNLFRELFERGKINTIEQWNKLQYKFMINHQFFTETARKKREPIKKVVLDELKNLI